VAVHSLGIGAQSDSRIRNRGCIWSRGNPGRLVLSVTACYGQSVPGDKEVEQMTIALTSFRRATRLVG